MQPLKHYSLLVADSDSRSELVRDGQSLGLKLDGLILDAQFGLTDGSLLWITEDSPYDERLYIYWLDTDNRVADAVMSNTNFTPGILNIIEYAERSVDFIFFNNDVTYRVTVLEKPRLNFTTPSGWSYRRLWRSHQLVIEALKS